MCCAVFVLRSMVIGDLIAVTLCYICATLQEAREVRVGEDELFTAMKRIDGSHLPTTFLAPYGVPPRNLQYSLSQATASVPDQVVMASNEKS
jgi:hypothetical protein